MSWWKRFVAIFKSEAADVKEGLTTVGKSLDAELARKEREMAATPEERIEMLLEEQEAQDARFDELTDKVLGKTADAEAVEEPAPEALEELDPEAADDPAPEHPEGD